MDRIASTASYCSFCLKGEMARDTSLYCFMGYNQRLGWMVRTSKDMMRKLVRRREDVCLWILKDICVHTNVHQRVISAEEGFNTQEDRITYCADTNQPLSPAIPVTAQRAQEQRDHSTDPVMEYLWDTHTTQIQNPSGQLSSRLFCSCLYISLIIQFDTLIQHYHYREEKEHKYLLFTYLTERRTKLLTNNNLSRH